MTTADIVAQLAAGKLSQAEALTMLQASQKKAVGLTVSVNKSGGIYIRHPKFVAHSTKKEKDYVAGINLDKSVAKALFGDEAVYKEIAEQVMSLVG